MLWLQLADHHQFMPLNQNFELELGSILMRILTRSRTCFSVVLLLLNLFPMLHKVGFNILDLRQAEQALNSVSTPNSDDCRKIKTIVTTMVDHKLYGRPWHGPLSPPRVSPQRTLGDALANAMIKSNTKKKTVLGWFFTKLRLSSSKRREFHGAKVQNLNRAIGLCN